MRQSITTLCACLLAGVLSSGCQNFKPVEQFAGQTTAVTATFTPMLGHAMHSCTNNVRRKGLIVDRPYAPQNTEQAATDSCRAYAQALAGSAELNNVLQRYAGVLAALANDSLSDYKDDIGALGTSLAGLQSSGGAPLLDADKLGKVVQLSELLSRVATQRKQAAGIRALLEREEDICIISDALKTFAQANYQANLRDENMTIATLNGALDAATAREPLASSFLKAKLYLDSRQLRERGKLVEAYAAAITELQRSISALRVKPMQDPGLARQLDAFASQVDILQRQATQYSPVSW